MSPRLIEVATWPLSAERPGNAAARGSVRAIQRVLRSAAYRGMAARWLRVLSVGGVAITLSACMQLGFLTVNAAAFFGDYSQRIDIPYGKLPANRLDIYLPAHAENCPVVVFFYGGGWKSGDKRLYKFVGAALAGAGIIAVIPNYRLYPAIRFPAFMQDAAKAVAWARRHAQQWGGDPSQLYLLGHSSGAYIAVMLALDQEYLRQVGGSTHWLRGVIGLAGPYDFLPFTDEYLKVLFGPPANFPSTQPINYVRPGAPPLLLMQGLRDHTVSPGNTRRLAAAMRRMGGQVKTQYFKNAGHAELVAVFSPLERDRLPVLQEVRAFIAKDRRLTGPARGSAASRDHHVSGSRPTASVRIGEPYITKRITRSRRSDEGDASHVPHRLAGYVHCRYRLAWQHRRVGFQPS